MTITQIDTVVQLVREDMIPESSTLPSPLSPHTHCDVPVSLPDEEDARPGRQESCEEEGTDEGMDQRCATQETRKRDRGGSSDDEWCEAQDAEERPPLSRPTEYLCSRCMACFGSNW